MDRRLTPEQMQELERLAALKASGALTDAEFERQKAALLGQGAEDVVFVPGYVRRKPKKKDQTGLAVGGVLFIAAALGAVALWDTQIKDRVLTGVPARFEERTDPFEGAEKLLAYALLSEREEAKLVFSCDNGSVAAYFSFRSVSEPWQLAYPFTMKTKLDGDQPVSIPFTSVPGSIGLAPAPQSDASDIAFLKRLRGKRRMVIQPIAEGFAAGEPPSTFDITGIDAPIGKVFAQCGVQG